mmetsp:Transcript_3511/g.7099  ORF Transcript_3511/g.7099 Transcript_3511/m.7099 type:complete len:299 (+) Transcript_3511:630-1526(+)
MPSAGTSIALPPRQNHHHSPLQLRFPRCAAPGQPHHPLHHLLHSPSAPALVVSSFPSVSVHNQLQWDRVGILPWLWCDWATPHLRQFPPRCVQARLQLILLSFPLLHAAYPQTFAISVACPNSISAFAHHASARTVSQGSLPHSHLSRRLTTEAATAQIQPPSLFSLVLARTQQVCHCFRQHPHVRLDWTLVFSFVCQPLAQHRQLARNRGPHPTVLSPEHVVDRFATLLLLLLGHEEVVTLECLIPFFSFSFAGVVPPLHLHSSRSEPNQKQSFTISDFKKSNSCTICSVFGVHQFR